MATVLVHEKTNYNFWVNYSYFYYSLCFDGWIKGIVHFEINFWYV